MSFAVIVVAAVFFVTGYYVLTATELIAGVIVFAWVTVFLRVSGAASRGRGSGAPVGGAG